jgi:hypothetical protein
LINSVGPRWINCRRFAIAAAANAWAAMDHNSDGTHQVVKIGGHDTTPEATVGRLTVYWDGTNLKYVKPDGTTGNIV